MSPRRSSPSRRTSGRCAGSAATRTRAPRDSPQRREMPRADLDQRPGGIGGQRGREGLGEFAERAVDHDAAVGRARRQVDGVELAQLEDMLGVDRVGIAQPALDVGDRERGRPRGPRRLRRGRALRLTLRRADRARAPRRDILARARRAPLQRSSPATAASRCTKREARSARRRAWPSRPGSPRRRPAPARNRGPRARCAAPADRGPAHGAWAG